MATGRDIARSQDLVEVDTQCVRSHLPLEHVRDGGGDQDLSDAEPPDLPERRRGVVVERRPGDLGGEQLEVAAGRRDDVDVGAKAANRQRQRAN